MVELSRDLRLPGLPVREIKWFDCASCGTGCGLIQFSIRLTGVALDLLGLTCLHSYTFLASAESLGFPSNRPPSLSRHSAIFRQILQVLRLSFSFSFDLRSSRAGGD